MGALLQNLRKRLRIFSVSPGIAAIAALAMAIFLGATARLHAQGPNPPPAKSEADRLFDAKDWIHAAQAYEAITANQPANGYAWFQLGVSLQSAGENERAIPAFQKALETGFQPNIAPMMRLARVNAVLRQSDNALQWLSKAVDAGFVSPSVLKTTTEFDSLRDDPRFKELSARVAKAAEPCKNSPEYRQFDFWVGKWDVQNPMGQPAGTSSIQQILNDCIILENWTGLNGYTGKSFNLFNKESGKWEQIWVDGMGAITKYEGQLIKEGVLEYHYESKQSDGSKTKHRLTFFKLGPDRVRQFSELSSDEGNTWTTEYDLTYIRKKAG